MEKALPIFLLPMDGFYPKTTQDCLLIPCLYGSFQMELNKKRESDIVKLRKDLEEQSLANEQTINSMRTKQNQALQETPRRSRQCQEIQGKVSPPKYWSMGLTSS